MVTRMARALAVAGVMAICMGSACKHEPNGPVSCGECAASVSDLTLVCPKDGETIRVGQTVKVKWCQPANPVPSVQVIAMPLAGAGPEIDVKGDQSIPYTQTEIDWTVPATLTSGTESFNLAGTQIALVVHAYGSQDPATQTILLTVTQ